MEVLFLLLAMVAIGVILFLNRRRSGDLSDQLGVGQPLPDFECRSESGDTLLSASLKGTNNVLLFVRGSWCPFCSEQVKALTEQYRSITEQGGRLIIVTRKPLDMTQRVAEQFGVSFDFWLDENLAAASQLGLVDAEGTPESVQPDYGKRTIRPTVLVTDRDNVIRYSYRSAKPSDRPDPSQFISVFDALA